MTEKRKYGKPPIYKTPSVRLTVQIEASTMAALEAWREGAMARSVAVNKLLQIGIVTSLEQLKRLNIPQPKQDGAKENQPN
jgi:hypothetical protein